MSSSLAASVGTALDGLVRRSVAVELGAVVALLVGFSAYTVAVDAVLDPYFLDSDTTLLVVRSALVLAGAGAFATAYARWRGERLPVAPPERGDARLVAAAVAGGALLALLPFSWLALRTGTGVEHVASTVADPGGVFGVRTLVRIGLFVPGMVLLSHGVVQGAIRHAFGERSPEIAVTALLGGYLAAPTVTTYGTFGDGPWLSLWGERAAVALLSVLALGAAVVADDRDGPPPSTLTRLPMLAAFALAALVLAAAADGPGGALVTLTRAAVIGVAAAVYDATDSLVAPAFVYTAFAAVSSVLYVATLAAAFGS